MKSNSFSFLLALSPLLVVLLPTLVFAQQPGAEVAVEFVKDLNEVILFPTIKLLSALAFLIFLWGCAEYVFNANNETAREEGRKHIMWGVIGLVIMLSAFTILYLVANTFGLGGALECADTGTC